MVCDICDYVYSCHDLVGGECPRCWDRYEEFYKNLPDGWKKLMGGYASARPLFDEWAAEQRIKKQLVDGKISIPEANKQAKELAERIRRKYNPTREESAAAAAVARARQIAETPPVFLAPSLFD